MLSLFIKIILRNFADYATTLIVIATLSYKLRKWTEGLFSVNYRDIHSPICFYRLL